MIGLCGCCWVPTFCGVGAIQRAIHCLRRKLKQVEDICQWVWKAIDSLHDDFRKKRQKIAYSRRRTSTNDVRALPTFLERFLWVSTESWGLLWSSSSTKVLFWDRVPFLMSVTILFCAQPWHWVGHKDIPDIKDASSAIEVLETLQMWLVLALLYQPAAGAFLRSNAFLQALRASW